ncbi:MAG: DNA polymerase I [Clostridiales bacterium]|nr:DNA polymerase I [Clostridiales bacterium]
MSEKDFTQKDFSQKDSREKILLIDGNSILNRAFYALPLLSSSAGEYTNGVYGFLNIFFHFMDEEQPAYAAVAFDLPKPTFRHKKYAGYKATRKSMPEELRPQVLLLQNLLTLMRIKIFTLEGYEADDLLGTLALQGEQLGLAPVIVTGDRDLLQMASEFTQIRIPKTKAGKTEVEDYYAADVLDKIGVTPREYIDVKALMGDASDNIPGVPGIGEKTAVKIIQTYKTLENSILHADEIKPVKASHNLLAYRDQAYLSQELAAILTDAPLELRLEEAGLEGIYGGAAQAEIIRLECKSILPRFQRNQRAQDNPAWRILSVEDAKAQIQSLCGLLAVFQFIWDGDACAGIGFAHHDGAFFLKTSDSLTETELVSICAPYLSAPIPKITLDSKKEMVYLHAFGIELGGEIFDVMLAGYVLNASRPSYDYSGMALDYLGEAYERPETFWGKGKNRRSAASVPEDELLRFVCRQAGVLFRLYPVMKEKLTQNNQWNLYSGMEQPLAHVLKDMELAGIRVNPEELRRYGLELKERIECLTEEITDLAGEAFNINSPQQLSGVLFDKLGLKTDKKNKQGYSTAADVLEKLEDDHPIVSKVLEYRSYTKLKSTYADGLLSVLEPDTAKIYSTFNQTAASTGRISSSEPNLQNIPIRIELGRRLRKAFIPTDDSFVFLDGDYSQIELRVLAHLADDPALIDAFQNGQDIHRLTASQVFNTPFADVTPAQRSGAKAVNFGIVYGISPFSLGQDLGISRKEAEKYIQGYFTKYPRIKAYLDQSIASAKEKGYAETLFHRRRPIPELSSTNHTVRSFGERAAMNMPVQGAAADIIKIAMIQVRQRLRAENRASRLILQVHDELLLEVKRDELEDIKILLKEEMEQAAALRVPLEADLHVGGTWYDAK